MRSFTIGKNDESLRLDRFVSKTLPAMPSSLIQKYIRLKRVKVNGKGAKRDSRLSIGDRVDMYINDEFFEQKRGYRPPNIPSKLSILYEDENIILLNKPTGMLCHSGGDEPDNLLARLQLYLYKEGIWNPEDELSFVPALCNRIDRNTEGLVIGGKNAEALRTVNEKIKNREIDRRYLAVVKGSLPRSEGVLESWLHKDEDNRMVLSQTEKPGYVFAETEYKVLNSRNRLSLAECRLVTGRTHQIRAQLADAGCPILGDPKYGDSKLNTQYGERHQLLCSYRLDFSFETDGGILNYLNGKSFSLEKIDFVMKYFNCTIDSVML